MLTDLLSVTYVSQDISVLFAWKLVGHGNGVCTQIDDRTTLHHIKQFQGVTVRVSKARWHNQQTNQQSDSHTHYRASIQVYYIWTFSSLEGSSTPFVLSVEQSEQRTVTNKQPVLSSSSPSTVPNAFSSTTLCSGGTGGGMSTEDPFCVGIKYLLFLSLLDGTRSLYHAFHMTRVAGVASDGSIEKMFANTALKRGKKVDIGLHHSVFAFFLLPSGSFRFIRRFFGCCGAFYSTLKIDRSRSQWMFRFVNQTSNPPTIILVKKTTLFITRIIISLYNRELHCTHVECLHREENRQRRMFIL